MNEEALQLAKDCYLDPVLFCRTFFPSVFVKDVPWFHRGLMALFTGNVRFLDRYGELDKIDKYFRWTEDEPIFDFTSQKIANGLGRYNCILLPAEHGRSTLTSLFLPAWYILYQESKLISYVEPYESDSRQSLAVLRRHFEENPRIIGIFGDLGIRSSTTTSSRSDYFEAAEGSAIMVSSAHNRVKSTTFNNIRPELIICNDVESRDFAMEEAKRRKLRNWFFSEIVSDSQVIYLANLKHKESLPVILERDPDWKVLRFPVLSEEDEPLWPQLMPRDRIEARRRSLSLAGHEDTFRLEYMNESPEATSTDFMLEIDRIVENFIDKIAIRAKFEWPSHDLEECRAIQLHEKSVRIDEPGLYYIRNDEKFDSEVFFEDNRFVILAGSAQMLPLGQGAP